MYIHDLNCGWIDHPFARNRFLIDDTAVFNKIIETGVTELYIDTELGLDVRATGLMDSEGSSAELEAGAEIVPPVCEQSTFVPKIIANLSPVGKFNHAKAVCSNASKLMQEIMRDVRLGNQVDLKQCEPMIDGIVESMYSFPSALLPLAQIKTRDEYTFQHSVSVAALAVAFGRVLDMPHDEIRQLAMGGLLHDVGKAQVPGRVLNKPGKLDEAEFALMKSHVVNTAQLIKEVKGISTIAFNAAAQHHERYDGTGYPNGLKGDEISLHGQMLAIVDVYDAITSIRVYHKGMPPTEALKKMYEWSGAHFNPKLVQAFIKGIGIYPAGSLVRMESDKLGIVREVVPDRLLQPIVQLIYDCKKSSHMSPETVDLAASHDKIKSHESFEKWGIDQARWATAHI
ncbi:MAG TPA: HD-GYP domain-containing protein [Gallionella sp.]|nr:HD-GYP domain-containing protein [Gallionella sp.]